MKLPFIISLPHCSERIPGHIRPVIRLSEKQVVESVDIGVTEIFNSISTKILLRADWSRLVVDLNRGPRQVGPKGVVALIDYHGRSIYHEKHIPDAVETTTRIRKYHTPFHQQMEKAIHTPGIRGLFDCHSLTGIAPVEAPDAGKQRQDITLSNNGDKQGNPFPGNPVTCPPDTLNFIKSAFMKEGFSVSLNDPYKGGYITTHYGRKLMAMNKFAVQIEINQALYVDASGTRMLEARVDQTRNQVQTVFNRLGKMDFSS